MMQNGNEWYWNLNLHRNQSVLNNSMAVNSTKLPISSAMYTSAVLTDRGICVGMRNVNLKGVTQPYSAKMQNIPNCCSNSNVVGQRNNQTWTAAFDRMRFSALTDPSMATQIECQHFEHLPPISDKWRDQVILPEEETINECATPSISDTSPSSISAEHNPFHLFGDKSALSTINVKNRLSPEFHQQLTAMNVRENVKSEMLTPPLTHGPFMDYRYLIENDQHYKHIGYPSYFHATTKSISSRSSSPISHLPCNSSNSGRVSSRLKAAVTTSHRRMHTNASRLNHVVAPKKKWIRNYMQSNSHLWFSLNIIFNCSLFFYLFLTIFYTLVDFVIVVIFFFEPKRMYALASDMCPHMCHLSKLEANCQTTTKKNVSFIS